LAESFLKYGFRVGDLEEVGVLRLQLDERGGGEIGRFDLDEVARVKEEGLHHLAFISFVFL